MHPKNKNSNKQVIKHYIMDKDEVKKSPKANLENQRGTAILMGAVLGLALMFFGFEWSSQTQKMNQDLVVQDVVAEEEILITKRDAAPPPPPPPPAPEAPEVLEMVTEKVATTIDINMEDNQKTAQQEVYTPPAPPQKHIEEVAEEVFVVVEQQPEFPGGQAALMKYLNSSIKYPQVAQDNGIQGRVITQFVVEKDGSITDVQVVKGADPSLDKEAIRVVKAMPSWKPGQQQGKKVRVRYTLPVVFRLQQ